MTDYIGKIVWGQIVNVSRISWTSELYGVLVAYTGLGISREPWKLGCLHK